MEFVVVVPAVIRGDLLEGIFDFFDVAGECFLESLTFLGDAGDFCVGLCGFLRVVGVWFCG